ncbi:MAG: hypothetical protein JW850_08170 [Thermoflexales bacterium]|nr:hypothetical protein [Thermoflexales bacterium]
MSAVQIDPKLADGMIDKALAFCASKAFSGDGKKAKTALRDGKCDVCSYFCYGLAKQVAEYLGQIDPTVKAVYVFEPEYAQGGDAPLGNGAPVAQPPSSINMVAWVKRKSAALHALVEALDTSLSGRVRGRLRCKQAASACYTLDVQMVDDAEVRERRGYGALVHSLYVRPIQVWSRTA